uniref:NADH dehydrogenase subunit 6 n=1 Tax=Dypsocus coleoptratus TaxID=297941 RepID=A0A8K1ZFC7_9NEOP|nr:NADH dehydrogenase subunit 6 [Dypsocus coleoptratus]
MCILFTMITLSVMTLLFTISSSPFSMGLILIFQTILMTLFFSPLVKSFWFFYLLLLIFIGGLLVLFLYVTTIFPNEKFYFKQKNLVYLLCILTIMSLLFFLIYTMYSFHLMNLNMQTSLYPTEFISMKYNIKMFNSHSNIFLILMVNYLFYCMIVVIKIINFFKGPLRKMNYV